jgi:hypothetical protein
MNPSVVKLQAWQPLLDVLDIECIIDLLSYKSTAINPPSCHNEVFKAIQEKYCLKDMLPCNFSELSKEEKKAIYQKTVNKIFSRMIQKAEHKYSGKEGVREGCLLLYPKDKGNIFVLCSLDKQSSLIEHCATYFSGALRNKKLINLGFIDLYKIDFHYRELFFYDKHKGIPPYMGRYDFADNESYDEYQRDREQAFDYIRKGDFWHESFHFDTDKRLKKCEWMDLFFSKLHGKYQMSEKDIFKDELYDKIMSNRQQYDKKCIEKILKEEEERWDDDEPGGDEIRSWDRDFPGWDAGL